MTALSNLDGALALSYRTIRGYVGRELCTSLASYLRPADATPYAINDVVSDHASNLRCIAFPNCGKAGQIVSAVLTLGQTVTADLDLFLFDGEPTNHADNAALTLLLADQARALGCIRFLDGAKRGMVNAGGIELYRAVSAGVDQAMPPIPYVTNDTADRLFGLLVTRTAFTPGSAAKITIRLGLERVIG